MGGDNSQKSSKKQEWSGYSLYPEDVINNFPNNELWALRYLFFYGNHKSPLLPVDDDADYLVNLLAVISSIYKKYKSAPHKYIFTTYALNAGSAVDYKSKALTGETIHSFAKPKLQQDSKKELWHTYALAALFFKIALKHEPEAHLRLNKNINLYLGYCCDLNDTKFDSDKKDELLIGICQKLQIYLSPEEVEKRISKSEEYMGYKNFEEQATYKRTAANLALACVTKELNILQNSLTVSENEDGHFASEASDTTSDDDSLPGDNPSHTKNEPRLSSESTSSDNIAGFAQLDNKELKEQTLKHRFVKTQNSDNRPNEKETRNSTPEESATTPDSYVKIIRAFPMHVMGKLRALLPSSQESNHKPLSTKVDIHEPNKCITSAQSKIPPTPRCTS